jgi:hypothetical protein
VGESQNETFIQTERFISPWYEALCIDIGILDTSDIICDPYPSFPTECEDCPSIGGVPDRFGLLYGRSD